MAKGKSVHVVPSPSGGWSVMNWGSIRASKKFVTKEEAVDWGRERSRDKGTALFIHRSDGTVQEKVSHSQPSPIRETRSTHAEQPGTHARRAG
jgi:hypothetical protein